jgi:hypothetical protein
VKADARYIENIAKDADRLADLYEQGVITAPPERVLRDFARAIRQGELHHED